MSQSPPSETAFRVAALSQNAPTAFSLHPDADHRRRLAEELDLTAIKKLSFTGTLQPSGDSDWWLDAQLGATIVQPCAVTLEPVTTRIDEQITRHFLKSYVEADAPEVEMPEDDTTEQLTAWIDPEAVLREALILNLPLYPRAAHAVLEQMVVTEPGVTPMRDEDARPFAGLAALREQMTGGETSDDD